jgi:hypothetical protein
MTFVKNRNVDNQNLIQQPMQLTINMTDLQIDKNKAFD